MTTLDWVTIAFFMRRLTGAGCLTALLTGFGMGVLRLLVDTPVTLGMPVYQNG